MEDKHPKLASFSTRRYLGPCKRALTGKRKENTRNDRSLGLSNRRPRFLVSITHIKNGILTFLKYTFHEITCVWHIIKVDQHLP